MVTLPQSLPPNREPTAPPATNAVATAPSRLIDNESISFSELAKRLAHQSTIHRWRSRGIRGCRLEAFRIGGRWYTNEVSFAKFCAAVTAATSDATPIQFLGRTTERVASALAKEGF